MLRLSDLSPAGKLDEINSTLEEVRGLLFAHGALFAHANNSRGLYRLRDLDGNDSYEDVVKLRETPGGVGHGRNQLALGPDGMIYLTCGDDVKAPAGGFDAGSPFQHFADDQLMRPSWDKFNWSHEVHAPSGHLVRTDAEGNRWEIMCGGLRNPFGLAFNGDGEPFTYDADMEWDIGLPWYRPTRILHLRSGQDYGWRGATRALPAWFPDTAPAVVDIGKGSPTGCVVGTQSKWPSPWKEALFALDWAYGRIHAITLTPSGGTYTGKSQIFLEGRPLNITSAQFGPDGQLYFLTGGRRTQAGLYRVSWVGGPVATEAKRAASAAGLTQRRQLEAFHGKVSPEAVATAWPHLSNADASLRAAARVALESQPVAEWRDRMEQEKNAVAQAEAALALARVGDAVLDELLWQNFIHRTGDAELGTWLRALQIAVCRRPESLKKEWLQMLESLFPNADAHANWLLCDLLVAGKSTVLVSRALPRCEDAGTMELRLRYLLSLSLATEGWTLDLRRLWLKQWLNVRTTAVGGPALPQQLDYARAHFLSQLNAAEKESLAPDIAAAELASAITTTAQPARPFVKAWTVASLLEEMKTLTTPPDLAAGKRLFTAATCVQCHRVGTEGAQIGPDLTAVGKRFDRHALVESVIEPWKVVADPYRMISVTTKAGAIHSGRLLAEEADVIRVATNPIEPTNVTSIPRAQVESSTNLSAMPPGLFYSLTATEVRDLLAWLERGGD